MKNSTDSLSEIIFGSSDKTISKQISRLVKKGLIKKIAPKIYSGNHNKTPELLIRENWRKIIAYFYPNSVVSHITAFMGGRIINDTLFITTSFTRTINLPGLTIRALSGTGPTSYDMTLPEKSLFMSSEPRYLMENLQTARQSNTIKKTADIEKVELYLEKIIRNRGEGVINEIRDKAKEICHDLNMKKEFKKLDHIIGALLTTRNDIELFTKVGRSRSIGLPYDPDRIKLFKILFEYLQNVKTVQPKYEMSEDEWRNSAFYDTYFSNYIEGTDFLVDEAKSIVFDGKIITGRMSDSHDILGTWRVLNDHIKMMEQPENANELIKLLKQRHHESMGFREEINPGEFKSMNNRAGNTEFVSHELVTETLKNGFEYYLQLDKGFQRATYIMFMIAEVHPFMDGNGRVSRIFMNAEMISSKHMRIIIPTVFRDDYLLSLRRLSRAGEPAAFVKMLSRAAYFSSCIKFSDINQIQVQLESCDAFKSPDEGQLIIPKTHTYSV